MGIGFRELLIILAIALVIFGAKRLKTIGSDLGGAVKGFKDGMKGGEEDKAKTASGGEIAPPGTTIEGEVKEKQKS